MAKAKKDEKVKIMSPVGRLINGSLFEKDVYTDAKGREGTPAYKAEMAFDEGDVEELEDAAVEVAIEEWGDDAEDEFFDGDIHFLIEGDELAKKRERDGKQGDAYKGKLILRTSTIFNANGDDAPGGVYVCDEDAEAIDFSDRGKIYNGCYGKVSVTLEPYEIRGDRGVKAYLNGFQFVRDGERLRSSDPSQLFKPTAKSEGKGRRRRGK